MAFDFTNPYGMVTGQPNLGSITPQPQPTQTPNPMGGGKNDKLALMLYALGGALKGDKNFVQNTMQLQNIQDAKKREKEMKENWQKVLGNLEGDINPTLLELARVVGPEKGAGLVATGIGKERKLTADQDNYKLAVQQGYKGTFMDYMKEKKAPLVTIDQKQETEFQKEATKSAFRTLEKAQQEVNQFVDIEGRLNILQKQLEGGELETGIFEEMKVPFQRLAAGLNILPEDELKKLGSKELFTRTVNYIVPRMRVAGSGSTSDTEVQLFRESAPSLQLEEGGNLLIVGGMSAVAKHNRERLKLMEKYMQDEKLGDGDLVGFGEYADKTLGPVFKSYDNDSFDKQVKEGKLKAGDFVYDGVYNEFRILTDDDIRGAR